MHEHGNFVTRLKRAHGHLGRTIEMLDAGRDVLEVAQQMQAVIGALQKAKTALVHDHIEHHLEEATGPLPKKVREQIAQLAELAKYL